MLVSADGDVADATPAPPDLHSIDSALGKGKEDLEKATPVEGLSAVGRRQKSIRSRKKTARR
jgi:hypothetical protein